MKIPSIILCRLSRVLLGTGGEATPASKVHLRPGYLYRISSTKENRFGIGVMYIREQGELTEVKAGRQCRLAPTGYLLILVSYVLRAVILFF